MDTPKHSLLVGSVTGTIPKHYTTIDITNGRTTLTLMLVAAEDDSIVEWCPPHLMWVTEGWREAQDLGISYRVDADDWYPAQEDDAP